MTYVSPEYHKLIDKVLMMKKEHNVPSDELFPDALFFLHLMNYQNLPEPHYTEINENIYFNWDYTIPVPDYNGLGHIHVGVEVDVLIEKPGKYVYEITDSEPNKNSLGRKVKETTGELNMVNGFGKQFIRAINGERKCSVIDKLKNWLNF